MMEDKAKYKSPKHKLLSFFENSRDQWKTKTKEGKKVIQLSKNRILFLEKSREDWKEKAMERKQELNKLKAEKDALEKELESLKKNL